MNRRIFLGALGASVLFGKVGTALASDVVVNGVYTPPGGVIRLDKPGQRLTGTGTVRGAVYITAAAVGAQIESGITLQIPPGFSAQAGAVQCAASRAGIHCTIDGGGNEIQGVQLVRYPASAPVPDGVNLDDLYVRNIGGEGFYTHGVYLQDAVNTTGRNLRFEDIRAGWALHFFGGTVTGTRLSNITDRRCLGDVVFWGSGISDNRVDKLLVQDTGERGPVTSNGGDGNAVDYVEVPAGYGAGA